MGTSLSVRRATNSSIVSDQSGQPFRIGDVHALKEDDVLISEILQANNPGCAAVAKLVAKLLFGIILKNDHGGLMLGQCHCLGQKLVIAFPGRWGRLQHLAGLVVPGLNDQCGVVGVVKRPGRGCTGGCDDGQSHNGQQGADV